ncbi:MAG: DUF2189 domain-containing protein [Alphaproteobacteria bacterium]|nr:DUF2189 domain-containing protein [Alphaproteobacteria bacterium]
MIRGPGVGERRITQGKDDKNREDPNMQTDETAPQPGAAARAKRAPSHTINAITHSDVLRSLRDGLRDFQRAPAYGLFFGLAYAAFGWFILYLMIVLDIGSYAYPMVTGFALVAPFAAAGLYEISRRLEAGEPLTWAAIFGCIFGRGGKAVGIMAIVTTFSYIIWLDIAVALYVMFFSMKPLRFDALLEAIITTPKGVVFFLVGNGVGAVLAVIVFSIMVISLPMVFDRQVDFVTAMITSVKSVLANPKPMLLWCAIIGVLLGLSLVSMFVGLLVTLPILGHATWHLYKRTVMPGEDTTTAVA